MLPPSWGSRPQEMRWPSSIRHIQRAVDLGEPLINTVAAVLEVPRETVRWLGRRALPPDWRMDMRRTGILLRLLSWLAPEQRPKTPADFTSLVDMGNALLAPFQRLSEHESYPDLRLSQYARIVRQWMGAHLRQGHLATAGQFAEFQSAMADSRDFLAAACAALTDRADPLLDEAGKQAWSIELLLDRLCCFSVRRLLALSRAWHEEVERWQRQEVAPCQGRSAQLTGLWSYLNPGSTRTW